MVNNEGENVFWSSVFLFSQLKVFSQLKWNKSPFHLSQNYIQAILREGTLDEAAAWNPYSSRFPIRRAAVSSARQSSLPNHPSNTVPRYLHCMATWKRAETWKSVRSPRGTEGGQSCRATLGRGGRAKRQQGPRLGFVLRRTPWPTYS